jgi:hypothetical protein
MRLLSNFNGADFFCRPIKLAFQKTPTGYRRRQRLTTVAIASPETKLPFEIIAGTSYHCKANGVACISCGKL